MVTKFIFKSAICPSREQSEKLLALGLKKETADMYMTPSWGGSKIIGYYAPDVVTFDDHFDENLNDLPAWSLHRLIEMVAGGSEEQMIFLPDPYDELIEEIAGAIMLGCFPKEYLV